MDNIIFFKYSKIYDSNWQIWKKAYRRELPYEVDENYTPFDYIKHYEKKWNEIESSIISYLEEILQLTWQKNILPCYIIRQGVAFSDPLTVPIKKMMKIFLQF